MAMIRNERVLTADRLREVLDYDPEIGVFRWKVTLSPKAIAGSVAGIIRKCGYRVITIDKEQHKASRLAWLYVYGEFPPRLVDHENRVKSDDRITNLRLALVCENSWNTGVTKANTSGFKGVCRTRWGWQASIACQGVRFHLGSFKSAADASAAYEAAAKRMHGEFACAA